jgi:putative membrane protein
LLLSDPPALVKRQDREPVILLVASVLSLTLSGLDPHDRFTWLLEVSPVLIALPLLVVTYSRFRLTPLLYRLLFIHAVILIVGGHYTYSLTPIGFWMQRVFGFARNHYDRIGHLAQGFVPAILTREILLRRSPLVRGKWLFFLVTCVCLAVSALYELLEWWTALAGGEAAQAFLGTQGDPWDTQWDMFLALGGAVSAQLTLNRLHDRHLRRLT